MTFSSYTLRGPSVSKIISEGHDSELFSPVRMLSDMSLVADSVQFTATRQEVVSAMSALSATDLCWVLHEIANERPELQITFVEPGVYLTIENDTPRVRTPRVRREGLIRKSTFDAMRKSVGDLDIVREMQLGSYELLEQTDDSPVSEHKQAVNTFVQFASGENFCTKDDKKVEIQVNRSGDKTLESRVDYYTQADNTARRRFVSKAGTLVFAPGDVSVTFSIKLSEATGIWDGMAEFKIHLVADSTISCELGHQLRYTRVKIIDSSTFPTDRYQNQLQGGNQDRIRTIHWVALLVDYFRLVLSSPDVRMMTAMTCFMDQVANLTYVGHLWCQVYLLDYIVALTHEFKPWWIVRDRESALLFIAAAQLGILAIVHMIAWWKFEWSAAGPQRKRIQQGVIKAFLNYDFDTAQRVGSAGLLISVLTRDAEEVVKLYLDALALLQNIVAVFVLAVFIVLYPLVRGKEVRPALFYPLIIFPVGQAIFILCRASTITDALHDQQAAQDQMLTFGNEIVANRSLVLDYRLRQHFVDLAEEYIDNITKSFKNVSMLVLNNQKFMAWMTAMLMAWWTVYGGTLLVHQSISIGFFIGTIKTYGRAGNAFGQAYRIALKMKSCIPALVRVCVIINGPCDLHVRHENWKANEQETIRRRSVAIKKYPDTPLNHLPIFMHDVKFKFGSGLTGGVHTRFSGMLHIKQGSLNALVGDEGGGKSTVLRLLGGAFVPSLLGGQLFIPTHLRVLHVLNDPLFFRGSIYYNLTVGCNVESDADPMRVQKVLDRLCLPRQIDIYSEESLDWKVVLTMTQRHKLNIARSLVSNPHVLCLHKPALVHDYEISRVIMSLLKEFVEERGVYLDPDRFKSRRPHTCIYTSAKPMTMAAAHSVFRISNNQIEKLTDEQRKAVLGRFSNSDEDKESQAVQ